MYKILLILFLSINVIFLSSCKREKPEVIGPELTIASPNFMIVKPFAFKKNLVNFSTDSNWFTATFNERVSWTITIKGTQSKAEKTMSGTSDSLYKGNTIWSGGHSGLYFFKGGEQVTAELTVFGAKDTWNVTATITGEKINYGNNVIVWWDMDQNGEAKQNTVYWFDFYDTNEKVLDTVYSQTDPLQGLYRAFEGKDGVGPAQYFIGSLTHTALSPYSYPITSPVGFNTSLDNIYLNFYVRIRTPTAGMTGSLTSMLMDYDQSKNPVQPPPPATPLPLVVPEKDSVSVLVFDVGAITWQGWKLVSFKLSDMKLDIGSPPFDPAKIAQMQFNLGIRDGNNPTGVDIDFITLTQGGPFNPNR